MINIFTSLETLKKQFPNLAPFYTQSWMYAGISSYFSQQNRFNELEFNSTLNDFVIQDWHGKINADVKWHGQVFEGHPDYWCKNFEDSDSLGIITGHEHLTYHKNDIVSLGFDYWDINTYNEFSSYNLYYEINRSSVKNAEYDVVIASGNLKKQHKSNRYRPRFLTQLAEQKENLQIVTDDNQTFLPTDLRFSPLGIEVYFNKFGVNKFMSYTQHPSFCDTNKIIAIPNLPHKKMYEIAKVNLVIETTTVSVVQPYVTEKTFKVLANHRPFVIFGDTNILSKLKKQGFKTFDEFCDESYDSETDISIRMNKIIEATKQLVKSCDQYAEEIDSICKHNQNLFFSQQRQTDNLARFGKLCLDILF